MVIGPAFNIEINNLDKENVDDIVNILKEEYDDVSIEFRDGHRVVMQHKQYEFSVNYKKGHIPYT